MMLETHLEAYMPNSLERRAAGFSLLIALYICCPEATLTRVVYYTEVLMLRGSAAWSKNCSLTAEKRKSSCFSGGLTVELLILFLTPSSWCDGLFQPPMGMWGTPIAGVFRGITKCLLPLNQSEGMMCTAEQ